MFSLNIAAALMAAALGLTAASGCVGTYPAEYGPCEVDPDCGSAFECTRMHECTPVGTSLAVRVVWTIDGEAPTPELCMVHEITEMSLTFIDREEDNAPKYSPIPCPLGRIFFDRVSPRFDQVSLYAHQSDGSIRAGIGDVPIPRDGTPIEMNFPLMRPSGF